MARNIGDLSNIEAPSSDYPDGRVMDESSTGANDGTPVNEAMVGDILTLFSRIMALESVTANALPDNNSNGYQLLQALDIRIGRLGLPDGAVTTAKLAANAVTEAKIAGAAVTAAKLAANAVTTAKINNGAVTVDKLASSAVSTAKIVDLAVTEAKIAANAITAAKIASNAVTTDKINAEAVTAAKMAPNAVTTTKVANSAITRVKLAETYSRNIIATSGGNRLVKEEREIGGWNMDLTASVTIGLSGITIANIRSVSVIIQGDSLSDTRYASPYFDEASGFIELSHRITPTGLFITRRTGGTFDDTPFDNVGINRGWFVIEYVEA